MSDRRDCRSAFERRLDDAVGEEVWQRHVAACDDCRAQTWDLGTLMAPLRDAEAPPVDGARLAALEDRFLAQIRQGEAPGEPATDRPERRRWLTLGAIAAGVLVLVSAAWLARGWITDHNAGKGDDGIAEGMAPPPMKGATPQAPARYLALGVTSTAGRVVHRAADGSASDSMPAGLSPGAELETMEGQSAVVLESSARDLRLQMGPRSRLRRLAGTDRRLRLERGEVMAEVRSKIAGDSLKIHTPHGTVTVRGTQFLVQTRAARTVVTVFRGRVRYRSRVSGDHLVAAGKRLEDDTSAVTVRATRPPSPTPGSDPMAGTMGSGAHGTGGKGHAATCSLKRVRRLIRTGRARAARAAIASCRKAGAHATTVTVLKMLDAQALLALGKVGAAVRAYHRIARHHRDSRLGQNALFTAGQLELSRLGQKKRALATFRRYLRTYPSGRYASEARHLARSLEAGK